MNLGELLVLRWQAELLDGHQLPGLALEEELEQREVVALRLRMEMSTAADDEKWDEVGWDPKGWLMFS